MILRAASAPPVHPGILDVVPGGPYRVGRGVDPRAIASASWPWTRGSHLLDPSGFSPSHRAARPAPPPAVLRRLVARFHGSRHIAASRELRGHRCSEDGEDVPSAGRGNARLLPALPLHAVGPPTHRVVLESILLAKSASPRRTRRRDGGGALGSRWGRPGHGGGRQRRPSGARLRAPRCAPSRHRASASSRPDRVMISPCDPGARGTARRAPIASRRRRFIESIPEPHIVVHGQSEVLPETLAETERIACESPHKEQKP